ncbi:MAG: DUF6279 family lipoprotein [Burkholderiales bacterium]|nr:DUF6279 family lipoprotein [Burkholderiales bacterium]
MKKSNTRVLFLSLCFFMTLLCSGCGFVGLGYSQTDRITLWWLDRYLDLSSAQKELLRPQLAQTLAWHKEKELPLYVSLIETQVEPLLAKENISQKELMKVIDIMELRYTALAQKAGSAAEPALSKMDSTQIAFVKQAFEKSNKKFKSKHLDTPMAEIRKRRADDFVDLLDDWFGTLTEAQKTLIEEHYKNRSIDNMLWWEERLVRQQLVLKALQRGTSEPGPSLGDALVSLLEPVSDKGKIYLLQTHKDTTDLLSQLWQSSSPEQKKAAREKLIYWKKQISKLM